MCHFLTCPCLGAQSLFCGTKEDDSEDDESLNLRPVALTSTIMKVFERVVLSQLQSLVADFLDPFQFAYSRRRGVQDAVLHVLHNKYSYLDKLCS